MVKRRLYVIARPPKVAAAISNFRGREIATLGSPMESLWTASLAMTGVPNAIEGVWGTHKMTKIQHINP